MMRVGLFVAAACLLLQGGAHRCQLLQAYSASPSLSSVCPFCMIVNT